MNSERWQQVEQLFHSALAWEPVDRSRLLRQACQGDEELQREVESLLSADQEALSLLDHRVDGDAADRLEVGSQFDCYRIEGLLGEGGMGGVYRARDVKLNREVAFKVLAQAIADDSDYLRRFEEEARLASSLNHPNIVTIYAVGEDKGVAYIAMELVRGRTLAELLGDGPLAMRRVLDLTIQLTDALATAHASGIVHRDLKPANIMVTAEDRIKVLDFGLAKRNAGVNPDSTPASGRNAPAFRSSAGVILGTVGYMSPEQAGGGQVDHTSDQFSFGAVLYEMLSGRRAFKRETAAQTRAAIIHEQPAPIQSLNPEVTEPLRQIVERCLAKDPSGRYPDTGELAAALREALIGWEASAAIGRGRWTRRRVLWASGFAAAGSALGLAWWRFRPNDWGIRLLAVLPFENMEKDPDAETFCEGLTESLIRKITSVPSLTVSPRTAVAAFKVKAVDPQAAGRKLRVDAIVSGSVVRRAGRLKVRADLVDVRTGTVLWSGRYDRDEAELLQLQDQIATAVVEEGIRLRLTDDDRRRLTRHLANDSKAYELYTRALLHHDRGTEEDYLNARELLIQAIDRDQAFALAYAMLAANYAVMAVDGYARPSESWPLVRQFAKQALALEPGLAAPHLELASELFFNQWNWAEAEKEFELGTSASSRNVTEVIGGYAIECWALGRPDEALRQIRRARAEDPVTIAWRLREADLLLRTGQSEGAATIYDAIIHDEPSDARAYFGLTEVLSEQKHFDEAIAQLGKGYAAAGTEDGQLLRLLDTARGAEGYRRVQERGAQLELDGLNARAASTQYVSPLDFARAYSRLKRRELAFKYLDLAFADRSPGLVFLRVDRAWDAIRDDARFVRAVELLGFTQTRI